MSMLSDGAPQGGIPDLTAGIDPEDDQNDKEINIDGDVDLDDDGTPPVLEGAGDDSSTDDDSGTNTTGGDDTPPAGDTGADSDTDDGGFDAALLGRATQAGLSEVEARSFETPERLQTALSVLDRQAAAFARQAQAPPDAGGNGAAQETAGQDSGPEEFKLDLNEEDYEPEVLTAFGTMTAEINRLRTELHGVRQESSSREQRDFENRFDTMLGGLGDEFKPLIGDGPTASLGAADPTLQARIAIADEMMAMSAGYAQLGRPAPSDAELVQRAARAVLGDQVTQQATSSATRKVSGQLRDRSGKFVQRPTHRNAKDSRTPIERAAEFVETFTRERGDNDDGTDETGEDIF